MKADKVAAVAVDIEIRINVLIAENQVILLETAQPQTINLETDQDLEVAQMIDVEENIDKANDSFENIICNEFFCFVVFFKEFA